MVITLEINLPVKGLKRVSKKRIGSRKSNK